MAIIIEQIRPVAHLPLVLGVVRKLGIATIIDDFVPPNPAHVLSCGRGVEALILAVLDGHHALYKVGARLEERGILPLLQEGLGRHSLNDYRLGQILDALFAANVNQVFGALALQALEVYAISTPWLHQDTTTITLYGAYEEAPQAEARGTHEATGPVPPRPAYGYSKDGHHDLKQVLLSLGVSNDGGLPLRVGIRDGNTSDSTETPLAIEECLALGLDGVLGIVADSKAYSQRTLGLCLEKKIGLVTLVPRTCAVRQELEAWGQQQAVLPLLLEKPGRTRQESPRRWHGQSVVRRVKVEDSQEQVTLEAIRFVVVHSSQLAQQQRKAFAKAHAQEAEHVTEHVRRVEARRFACAPDAEAAIADYTSRGQGRRGRKPRLWRSHMLHYRVEVSRHRQKRARRGRPPKTEVPQEVLSYRLVVEVNALPRPEEEPGWTILATTVGAAVCSDTEILQAYHDQNTTVEPGFRWIKNPAAISPVWLEKPERIAALAMLTVVGLLVYTVIQRQVRLYLRDHEQQLPGNKGLTSLPTAAVILALFGAVTMVHLQVGAIDVLHIHGLQEHHGMICDALAIDRSWYGVLTRPQNRPGNATPP